MDFSEAAKIKPFSNYHTHTTFCDGSDTPYTMAAAAVEKGFSQLGFSAHAMYPYSSLWHMQLNRYEEYCVEIRRLQKEYEGRLEIFLGFEADWFPLLSTPIKILYAPFLPDYLIGSVHFLTGENPSVGCFTVDGPAGEVAGGLQTVFGGDTKKAVQAYFAAQREMAERSDCDIIGHADIIRKRNGELRFFDETEGWYKRELEATAKVFAASGKVVEINTGGISRGTIDDTYPSADFLSRLFRCGVPVVINSDSHSARALDCAYDRAFAAAKNAGYRETAVFQKGSDGLVWKNRPL